MSVISKYIVLLIFLLISLSSKAQQAELWGVTPQGGEYNLGSIFKVDSLGENFEEIHSFETFGGLTPREHRLIDLNDGFLYGVTFGSLFKVDTTTLEIQTVKSISYPAGGLLQLSSGRIIGAEQGVNNYIYEYNSQLDSIIILLDLDTVSNLQGASGISGSLVEAVPNKLIGSTFYGGNFNSGIIFQFNLTTQETKILHHYFNSQLKGSFFKASNGKLYGAVEDLIEIDPITESVTILDRVYPTILSNFIELDSGSLYGATSNSIIKYDYLNNQTTTLASFTSFDGRNGSGGGIIKAQNGKIYGSTGFGTSNVGAIYEYDLQTDTLVAKRIFTGINGPVNPSTSLYEVSTGLLIGFSHNGGKANDGTLFSYSYVQDTFKIENHFRYAMNGESPSKIFQAGNGLIYGTTLRGGENNQGVLYEVNPNSNRFKKIHDFEYSISRGNSASRLNMIGDSLLIGTSAGLFGQEGTIYSYNLKTSTFSILHQLNDTNSAYMAGQLITRDSVNFYGYNLLGGNNNRGFLYKYSVNTGYEILAHAPDSIILIPNLAPYELQFSNDSTIISNANYALNEGLIFKFNINSNEFEETINLKKYAVQGTCEGEISLHQNNIYGIATNNNPSLPDVLYSYNLNEDTIKLIHSFSKISGGFSQIPLGGFYINGNNQIIGVTQNGGVNSRGSIYNYDLSLSKMTVTNNSLYGSPLSGLYKVNNVCRESINKGFTLENIEVCFNETIDIQLSSDSKLNYAEQWVLYADGIKVDSSSSKNFTLSPTQTTIYSVRAEGGCPNPSVFDSIQVVVKPDTAYLTVDSVNVCYLSSYTFSDGMIINGIAKDFIYRDTNQSAASCDSSYITHLFVFPEIGVKDSSGNLVSNALNASSYQWFNCRTQQPILNATERIYSPTDTGLFYVEVTQKGCTANSDCLPFYAVGLKKNSFGGQVSILPNPTKDGKLVIETTTGLLNFKVKVLNLQGQLLEEKLLLGSKRVELEIKGKSGIYFIQLTSEKGEQANYKVVKK